MTSFGEISSVNLVQKIFNEKVDVHDDTHNFCISSLSTQCKAQNIQSKSSKTKIPKSYKILCVHFNMYRIYTPLFWAKDFETRYYEGYLRMRANSFLFSFFVRLLYFVSVVFFRLGNQKMKIMVLVKS